MLLFWDHLTENENHEINMNWDKMTYGGRDEVNKATRT